MTSRDFIRAEAENRDRIILYREGLFWKAYERSAYILCRQVRPLKPTKKSLKSLDGAEIVSVGFPWKHEQKYVGGLERIQSTEKSLTLAAASAIDPADFENWKALLPLHTPSAVRTDGTTAKSQQPPLPAADAQGIGAYPSEASPAVPNGTRAAISDEALPPPAERTSDTALSAAHAVAERVRLFNLAESTPMECMLFISDLKKTLQTP